MISISGKPVRRALLAAIVTATLGLTACGGDDPTKPTPSKTTAVDKTAEDEKALEKLATDLWRARTKAYNSGDTSREQFDGLLSVTSTEIELGQLKKYEKLKVLRTGAPEITSIETSSSGDTGEILLCLNEDSWNFEEDGKPLEPSTAGPGPWGAKTERTPDGWIVLEELKTTVVEKTKTC